DETTALWLNRERNRYNSKNLNDLLQNLMEEAGIDANGRKLTWHSIRHSTGMYVYDRERDLGIVAEILRHKSLEAARKYAHPTPETKKDVIESIQGGGAL
ncbi:MAG: tyrosine-type recombinase/integrase, partial [Halobacteriaceae archaeon]